MLSWCEPPKPTLTSPSAPVRVPTPALPFQGSQRAQLEQSSAQAQLLQCQGLGAPNVQNKGSYWDFTAQTLYRASVLL